MKDKCALEPTADLQKSCETTAELYAMGPNLMGCPAFTAGQKEACECVDAGKADKLNRERLEHFLAHQAKDGAAEDVDGLLAKYKGKEPVMFLRLLTKYPDAITLKKARVSEHAKMFEALKKKTQEEASSADEHSDVEAHIEL
ncbi:hypothetical protein DYB32_000995 [Aphanomyces invadans]|nr:hypothetical protein DYB32_000995 [Aphanomyces invadans]